MVTTPRIDDSSWADTVLVHPRSAGSDRQVRSVSSIRLACSLKPISEERNQVMPDFRMTLRQNLPNRDASAFDVTYVYSDGRVPQTWRVYPQGTYRNKAVVTIAAPVDLIGQHNVTSRTLVTHYPVAPTTVETAISSVQPALAAHRPSLETAMTPYQLTITMNQATYNSLAANNFILYGFKAVKSTSSGQPVVWFQGGSSVYAPSGVQSEGTVIDWQEQYTAYTSNSEVIPGGTISVTNSYGITFDQTLNVGTVNGEGNVVSGGTEGAISIYNMTSTPMVCGIGQIPQVAGSQPVDAAPICAFPLFGQNMDVVQPIEQVFLMFATEAVNTGAVVEQSFGPGIGIDLTGENSRTVNYDINAGWSWQPAGASWAQAYPPSTNLVPLLVQSSQSLARRRITAANPPLKLVA
jgi:hypothetical protein